MQQEGIAKHDIHTLLCYWKKKLIMPAMYQLYKEKIQVLLIISHLKSIFTLVSLLKDLGIETLYNCLNY